MFKRQTTGSVVCASCGYLVGVNDPTCYNCGRRYPGLWGFAPMLRSLGQDLGFVPFVIGLCAVLYVVGLVFSGGTAFGGGLFSFLSPSGFVLLILGASGQVPVFGLDRWWTVLSASWLHGGLLHILFNMLWVRQLAPATADLYGPGRMMIIYTLSGVTGFGLSSVMGYYFFGLPLLGGAAFTLGASAPIFGLLGALVYYARRTGSSLVGATALQYAAILFAFGLFMNGVDNYAHAGGFAGGWLVARWLDPMTRERVDHLIAGLLCILATFIAVAVSIVTGIGLV